MRPLRHSLRHTLRTERRHQPELPEDEEKEIAVENNPPSDLRTVSDDQSTDVKDQQVPPPLPFDLREHKRMILLFAFLFVTETCFIPEGIYYGLVYGTSVSKNGIFWIITSLIGVFTGLHQALRTWRLLRKPEYRPLNGTPRWYTFDATDMTINTAFTTLIIIMLIFFTRHPHVRGLSMALPVATLIICCAMLATGIAHFFRWRLRLIRLSSHVPGDVCPPLTYCFLEDTVAVDGKGGKAFREAARARYDASPRFRKLLVELLWAWSLTGIAVSAALIALIWTIRTDVAYGLAWGVPQVWGFLGACLTIPWVKRGLAKEKANWLNDRLTQT